MDAVPLILWGHALAALLFGMLAVQQARGAGTALPRRAFVAALAATALWALAVAGIDARDVAARVAETVRNLAWLGFMYALIRRDETRSARLAVAATYGVVALVSLAAAAVAMIEAAAHGAGEAVFATARVLLQMMAAVASLVLAQRLYIALGPNARGGVRVAVLALGAMWAFDLVLYTVAHLSQYTPAALVVARGVGMAALVPVLAVAAHRDGDWTLAPSRAVAFRTLSLVAIGLYVAAMVLASGLFAAIGGAHARVFQTAFVAGTGASLLGIVASPWLRAWVRVKLAKHLFRHRYDYRHEWTRFTATLGHGDVATALDARIVKAVADLVDSPAGLLLVPDGDGLGVGASWNWVPSVTPARGAAALAAELAATGRIVALDDLRAGSDDAAALVPQWLLDAPAAWAIVPLIHSGGLAGAVVLARPALARALDWEDFDLLRVAGSQGASYLAEARAVAALGDAQRFDEFNRRFAFIIHDVKNLVSQLTLVARNAERHADNPEFRADMVATLQDSCGRMNDLLARLSQHHGGRADPVRATELLPIVERIAARRRGQHPVLVEGAGAVGMVDPARFEQLLGHLVQNAVEASPPAEPVIVSVGDGPGGVVVGVTDRGCGMAAGFVRDELFRPFVSSKPGGFGIGAFEARQLALAMGGRIEVASREGEGTRFTVSFPAAVSLERAA